MKNGLSTLRDMRAFLVLSVTQGFSGLGSAMTNYALILWSYQQEGSALVTALLTVCSYAPYVLMSIFAGALTDRLSKKKILLVCDALAAAWEPGHASNDVKERKAAMVSNLLVVLCGNKDAQPVVNSGSLY